MTTASIPNAAPAAMEYVRNGALIGQLARPVLLRSGEKRRPAVGLGTNGYSTGLLRVAGLEREARPFDALFASPRMLAHCLDDDFATLLAREHYQSFPLDGAGGATRCEHAWYRDAFGQRFLFADGFDPTRPEAYAALRSRVEAFREIAHGTPATYLVVTPDALLWQNGFALVSRALHAYAPLTRLVYAVVREAGEHLSPKLGTLSAEDGHRLIEFRASSRWDATGFESPLDDVALLLALLERL